MRSIVAVMRLSIDSGEVPGDDQLSPVFGDESRAPAAVEAGGDLLCGSV